MALRCFPSSIPLTSFTEKHCNPIRKHVCGVILMRSHNTSTCITLHYTSHIRSLSLNNNKIFEDQSKGIICYRDEKNGEIICEGYDEGPRVTLNQNLPTSTSNPNPRITATEEIIDLLQRIWLLND